MPTPQQSRLLLSGGGLSSPLLSVDCLVGLSAFTPQGYSDGQALPTWVDISSRGNDAVQGTGGSQPLYKSLGMNSHPSVYHDGVDDYLTLATSLTTVRTLYLVVMWDGSFDIDYAPLLGDSTAFDFHGGGPGADDNLLWLNGATAASIISTGSIYSNGTLVASPLTQLKPTTPTVLSIVTSAAVSFNRTTYDRANVGRVWRGYYSEIWAYDTAHSDGIRKVREQFLGTQYGISIAP